jgi:mannose-1-phosphate guanylyltransferase
MHIVLLSGGSGTRLWPLSNAARSKQFLKLLSDENGSLQSMAQRVYGQIQAAGIDVKSVTVATSESQVDSIRSQLGPDVSIVTEPERRNTYPAILLACADLLFERNLPPDEAVIVLPVDPYTDTNYFLTLQTLADLVRSGACNIALMGVKPTFPTAKYGYILPDGSFAEKPDPEKAKVLIKQGALWNCGVFAFTLGYIAGIMEKAIHVSSFAELRDRYGELKKTSFDYEVLEKEPSIKTVAFNGIWEDLGTWASFTAHMGSEQYGKVVTDNTCSNTNVINELSIPLVVSGVRNCVICACPDGILVTDKFLSSNLKPLVEQVPARPMFAEFPWGISGVMDCTVHDDGTEVLIKRTTVWAGQSIPYTMHRLQKKVWTVTFGEG